MLLTRWCAGPSTSVIAPAACGNAAGTRYAADLRVLRCHSPGGPALSLGDGIRLEGLTNRGAVPFASTASESGSGWRLCRSRRVHSGDDPRPGDAGDVGV